MQANRVIAQILKREGLTAREVSCRMGRERSYLASTLNRKSIPTCSTMARILDTVGYDLIARSRADDYEFEITE